jgi:CheY-like chemotaxis protein
MAEAIKSRVALAVVDDMFFSTKIETAARHAGVSLIHAASPQELALGLEEVTPDIVLVDLNNKSLDPLGLIRRIKGDDRFALTTVVAFYSHVQTELEQAAAQAGCDRILPRSVFSKKLGEIIVRESPQ